MKINDYVYVTFNENYYQMLSIRFFKIKFLYLILM